MASAKRRLALGVWRIMWHLLRHICVALQRTLGRKVFTVGKAADWPQSAADHEWMRQACQTGTEMVRAVQEAAPEARIFKPAPVDQMYQGAAVSFTYFFKDHNLQPDLLKRALQRVLGELPHLAGRGRVLGRGNRLIDSVIECTNEGVVVATASARNIRLLDVGPHTWATLHSGCSLEDSPMPFYGQPLDAAAVTNGKEAPMQIRLTDLADGQVLCISCWHAAVDAGSGIKLAKRLSQHYRALSTGQVVAGQALKAGSMLLHSPADLMEALADDVSSPWEPNPVSTRMSLKQWLSAPFLIYRTIKSRWDVHMIYLPGEVVARVKAATIAAGGFQISTNDAVQAMIFTLYNDLRGKPLVPTSPQMFTVTADILHGRNLKDTMLPDQYFGNAVEVVFLEGGVKGLEPAQFSNQQDMFLAALAANARRVREGISAYRADWRPALDTMATYHNMVRIHKLSVAANFIVKGAEQKCASASCITKFPIQEVDFGSGAPLHMQVHLRPWCDWWYIYHAAAGIDDGEGMLMRAVVEQGMAQKLKKHHLWKGLAAGAQLALAGERVRPFGGQPGRLDAGNK